MAPQRLIGAAAVGTAGLLLSLLTPVVTASALAPAPVPERAPEEITVAAKKGDRGPRGNRIRVSKVVLSSAGGTIVVRGRGFDRNVGIYVGFCVTPRAGQKPSPCGGGADTDGSTGASAWISSNPPPYGQGTAIPYGRGGSFKVRLSVSPSIITRTGTINCRITSCAITTRADHTRANDRTWDLAVPIRFR